MFRLFSRCMFGLLGWRIENHIPRDLRKYVVIAAPHTSWTDFFIGLFSRSVVRRDIKFLGKKSLFKPPVGWLMRALGGHPVDRSARRNMVEQVVGIFNSKEAFAIALAPEGTRKKVDRFKTGFYYISLRAGVPIIMTDLDYQERVVRFNEPFHPTGDIEADLQFIWDHYKEIRGRHPESGIH